MSSSAAAVGGSSSSSAPGGASSRVVVQDYIARIRYSNALPPPPTPPKLLVIPAGGLEQYTSAGFAARLAREQPLTVEADAELGMPIDMVGVPGVFFEDDTYITAAEPVPVHTLHPTDKGLLRPITSVGSGQTGNPGVAFLRRTEYITSGASRNDSAAFLRSKGALAPGNEKKPTAAQGRKLLSKDDPLHITRTAVKGFDLAYPYDRYTGPESGTAVRGVEPTPHEKDAWDRPRHPTNPALKPMDMYPILPDFAAIPDTGSYIIMKFKNNPVGPANRYDERLDAGLFHVVDPNPTDLERYQEQVAAREKDPSLAPVMFQYDFDLFLPSTESTPRLKRKLSMYAPDRDDETLYDSVQTDDQTRSFKLQRVRRYETYQQNGSGPDAAFGESVGIALHDPEYLDEDGVDPSLVGLPKAAYIYGIRQRTSIRPKRPTEMAASQQDEAPADAIELTVRDRTRRELRHIRQELLKFDPELPARVMPELAGEWDDVDEEDELEEVPVVAVDEDDEAVDEEEEEGGRVHGHGDLDGANSSDDQQERERREGTAESEEERNEVDSEVEERRGGRREYQSDDASDSE